MGQTQTKNEQIHFEKEVSPKTQEVVNEKTDLEFDTAPKSLIYINNHRPKKGITLSIKHPIESSILRVCGTISYHNFSINFSEKEFKNTHYHLSPRPYHIVQNSCVDSNWWAQGGEEIYNQPVLKANEKFELTIKVENDCFVTTCGNHQFSMKKRRPLENIDKIIIGGECEITMHCIFMIKTKKWVVVLT